MVCTVKKIAFAAALAAAGGCFDEPVSAIDVVPSENRVYRKDENLGEVPSDINPKADYLNLDRNVITNAAAVSGLKELKWLRLNDNRLSALPELEKLVKLRRIYLRNNRFTAVPPQLKDLPSLTDIDLSGNPISEIPSWLSEKKGLKNLSFSRTKIEKLPENLEALRTLHSLQLGDLRMSAAEMARIRKALPKVAIVF